MERTARELMLMRTADLWAEKGTCSRLKVGAVFAREGRILVQGYNGAPAGLPHCPDSPEDVWEVCHFWDDDPGMNNPDCNLHLDHRGDWYLPRETLWEGLVRAKGHTTEECRAVHAEQNGISWAAREGVGLKGADLYCTHQPCINCARSIINAGIRVVTFRHPYRLQDGIELLAEAGVYLYQFDGDTRRGCDKVIR